MQVKERELLGPSRAVENVAFQHFLWHALVIIGAIVASFHANVKVVNVN